MATSKNALSVKQLTRIAPNFRRDLEGPLSQPSAPTFSIHAELPRSCGAWLDFGLRCSRSPLHTGAHVAYGYSPHKRVFAIWHGPPEGRDNLPRLFTTEMNDPSLTVELLAQVFPSLAHTWRVFGERACNAVRDGQRCGRLSRHRGSHVAVAAGGQVSLAWDGRGVVYSSSPRTLSSRAPERS